jgi:hypothetical protein
VNRYDVLLVLAYFRPAAAYLSIIKRRRIGLLVLEIDPALRAKNANSHAEFVELCVRLGAELVPEEGVVEASLMVVQQFTYDVAVARRINDRVRAAKRVGLMALAMAGVAKHDAFIELFGIRKVFVPSRRFMDFLLTARQAFVRYCDVDVVEVGLPFAKYPVFPEFEADYLIAAPTLFSFNNEAEKQRFLRTVLGLLAQIPTSARVVYKPHNGFEKDYFAPKFHYALARALRVLPGIRFLLSWACRYAPAVVARELDRIRTTLLHQSVLRRAIPMSRLTRYAEMPLEAFLPGVKCGVIGGLSNTIWGTLYFNVTFFNCVSPDTRVGDSQLLQKKSDALLDLNLKYFGVPYCAGRLDRGARGESIVVDADREGDIIAAIQRELETTEWQR